MLKLLPVAVFAVLVGFLAKGLSLDPREVPSPFIGKPAPQLQGPQLNNTAAAFNSESLLGQVWILNIWASWCVACVHEHEHFLTLAEQSTVPLVGLNYKDQPGDALTWLQRLGNPYSIVVTDIEGKVGLDWGVYGVPETFIIDKQGQVQHKFIGPVDAEDLTQTLIPLVNQLQGSAT